jgi:hypothetical protein
MIKKIFLLAIILLSYTIDTYSASYTTISNDQTISSTWSGTVYVSQTVTITSGAKITVSPGAVIKLAHGVSIITSSPVEGFPESELILQGTQIDTIIITSMDDNSVGETISGSDGYPNPGDWNQLYLNTTNTDIRYVHIKYGALSSNYSVYAALRIGSENSQISNTTVAYSGQYGVILHHNATLINCYIHDCEVTGVGTAIEMVDSLSFIDCSFKDNAYHGVNAIVYSGDIKVENCSFENNGDDGLSLSGSNSSIGKDSTSVCFINSAYTGNVLEGNGLNAFYIKKLRSTEASSLYNNDGIPYAIDDIEPVSLSIYEGTIIKSLGTITVPTSGDLNIYGTKTNPVIFTSIKDDSIAGDTNNDNQATSPTEEYAIVSNGTTDITEVKFYYSKVEFWNRGTIRHSTFENVSSYGGSALSGVADIDSCSFNNNFYGFKAASDTSHITNCIFTNNDAGIVNRENVAVENSRFENNRLGVKVSYGYYTNLGKNNTDSIGNNIFTNNTEYDIYNNSEYKVYAIKNTFDGLTSDEIDAKIYDDNEDSTLGEVIFSPWQKDCSLEKLSLPTGITEVCENINVNLYSTENINPLATVNWVLEPETAGTLSATGNNVTVTWNLSYIGEVKLWAYLSEDDCIGDNSDTLTIERIALPEKPVITEKSELLVATSSAGYQWYIRVGSSTSAYFDPINGATEKTYLPTESGTYTVEINNINGCSSLSDTYDYFTSGLLDKQLSKFIMYPNPSNGNFSVQLGDELQGGIIIISDALGSLVKTQEVVAAGKNTFVLNVVPGIYFVKYISNNN